MAAVWTPVPVDPPLIIAQEDQVNVNASIHMADDGTMPGNAVTSITWSSTLIIPAQFVFTPTIVAGTGTLAVHIPDFTDVFKIVDLRYLRNKVPGICYRWADLPVDAEDVLAFHPDPVNIKNFPIDVTAHFSGIGAVTVQYIIQVFANYTLGKNLLTAAVDARR